MTSLKHDMLIILSVILFSISASEAKKENAGPAPKNKTDMLDIIDFETIVETPGFVDKSMLIKEFLEGPPRILITAPHEFGKTINLDMIRRFMAYQNDTGQNNTVRSTENSDEDLTDDCKLFIRNNLKIYEEDKEYFYEHCGQYPAIYLDFIDLIVYDFDEMINSLKYVVYVAFRQHSYMVVQERPSSWNWTNDRMVNHDIEKFLKFWDLNKMGLQTELDLKKSLFYLSDVVHTYHGMKVTVMIDEFDAIWLKSINQIDSKMKMAIDFYTRIIFIFLASNHHIHRVFLTSCMKYASMITLNKVQAIKAFEFGGNHSYAKYYGFTGDEVKGLLKEFNAPDEFEDIRHWYNGYRVHGQDLLIFNPWSILHYVHSGVLKTYWNGFKYIHNIRKLAMNHEIRKWLMGIVHEMYVIVATFKKKSMDAFHDMKIVLCRPGQVVLVESHWNDFFRYLYECRNVIAYSATHITKSEVAVTVPNNECVQEIFMYLYSTPYYEKHFKFKKNRRFALLDSFDALATYDNPRTTFANFTETLARLYSFARLPDDDYALGFSFYHMFRLSKLFRHVNIEVSKMIGPSRNVDLTVLREDGTFIIMATKYVNGSAKDSLLQIIDSGYYRILDRRRDYRNLTASNSSKIYMGVFLNDKKFVEVCYLVNSIYHKDLVCLSSTRNLGLPQIPAASTDMGSEFYIPLSSLQDGFLPRRVSEELSADYNYSALMDLISRKDNNSLFRPNMSNPFGYNGLNITDAFNNMMSSNLTSQFKGSR